MELLQERLGGRMALVCDVNVGGQTLVAYNLHLESRGSEQLRRAQLVDVLDDSQRYGSEVPLIIAGDMNFDVSRGRASQLIQNADFRNAFAESTPEATAPSSLLHPGHAIDWILTRGPVQHADARVHGSIDASDHYPLSLTLGFQRFDSRNNIAGYVSAP